ncbi:MAG: hypothetical protein LPJ89_05040, partial [Hymenobacteraceae bacterium]|nr:hypothetical protein [Hymenobacteraceae bacterium]
MEANFAAPVTGTVPGPEIHTVSPQFAVTFMSPENFELKKKIYHACLQLQQDHVHQAKSAMEEVQESANEHIGSMEDKFESFRENCQIQRDMYAKQLDEALTALATLKRIDLTKEYKEAMLGALVETEQHKYFISVSLGEVKVDGKSYFAISTLSPLFKAMAEKK